PKGRSHESSRSLPARRCRLAQAATGRGPGGIRRAAKPAFSGASRTPMTGAAASFATRRRGLAALADGDRVKRKIERAATGKMTGREASRLRADLEELARRLQET